MRAVLIPVDEPPREVNLPNGGSRFMCSIRALIGTDCAERIQVTTRWEAWLDENGASAGKPVNQAATLLAQSFGWQLSLRGTTVIVGLDEATDTPADLVPHQIEVMLRKIGAQ
ncbi:MAG TPA: DUF3846 domain-containing protein [Trebonia sp.]